MQFLCTLTSTYIVWCHEKFIGWPGGLFSTQKIFELILNASWPKNVRKKGEKSPKFGFWAYFLPNSYSLWASFDANVVFFRGPTIWPPCWIAMVHDRKRQSVVVFFAKSDRPPLSFSLSWSQPRANEAGGMYGKGVIARKYQKNQASSQSLFQ